MHCQVTKAKHREWRRHCICEIVSSSEHLKQFTYHSHHSGNQLSIILVQRIQPVCIVYGHWKWAAPVNCNAIQRTLLEPDFRVTVSKILCHQDWGHWYQVTPTILRDDRTSLEWASLEVYMEYRKPSQRKIKVLCDFLTCSIIHQKGNWKMRLVNISNNFVLAFKWAKCWYHIWSLYQPHLLKLTSAAI